MINKTCAVCNKIFPCYPSDSKRFCSPDCFREHRKRQTTSKVTCLVCSKAFYQWNKRPRKYCSDKCFIARPKKMISKDCQICNKSFDVIFNMRNKRKFCSHACYAKHRSITYVGKNHPLFKGRIIQSGYVTIFNKTHPFANKQGHVPESRLIAEKHLNRYLDFNEIVHHINQKTMDNRPENLFVFESLSQHKLFHIAIRYHGLSPNWLISNIIPTDS